MEENKKLPCILCDEKIMEDELDKKLDELAHEQGFIDIEDMLYYECTGTFAECDDYYDYYSNYE